MTALKVLVKMSLAFILFTVIGQIRVGERTLENRYHRYVNSEGFQAGVERLSRPITWAVDKASDAIDRGTEAARAR